MAADATLVNAAFREGQTGAMAKSNVINMSPMFESQKRVQKTYMDTITNVMDIVQKKKDESELAKTTQLKPIKEDIQKAYSALQNGEPLPEFIVDAFTSKIESLQDSFEKVNTEGKGDTRANEKERRRITAELVRVKNQAIEARSKFQIAFQDPNSFNDKRIKGWEIGSINSVVGAFSNPEEAARMVKNGEISADFVGGELNIHTRVGQVRGHVEPATDTYDPTAEVTPATDEVIEEGQKRSYTASSFQNALPYKNLENDARINDYLAKEGDVGKNDAKAGIANKYTDNNAVQAEIDEFHDKIISNDENYYDISGRRFLGAPSFEQALDGMVGIPIDILNNMFLDGNGEPTSDMSTQLAELDKNGDGAIDSTEYPEDETGLKKFMVNIEKAKEQILERKELGAPIMAKYFADMKIKKYNDSYSANLPKTKTPTTTATTTSTTTSPTTTSEVSNFAHINKGQYIPLAGVSVQKGSLENIRTAIKSRTPGGFYLGPKGDEKAFVPVGENNWEMRDSDGKVLATYNGVSQLIKSGLKTSDKGFRSLITMDIDGDGIPDGPVRENKGSAFELNLDLL